MVCAEKRSDTQSMSERMKTRDMIIQCKSSFHRKQLTGQLKAKHEEAAKQKKLKQKSNKTVPLRSENTGSSHDLCEFADWRCDARNQSLMRCAFVILCIKTLLEWHALKNTRFHSAVLRPPRQDLQMQR